MTTLFHRLQPTKKFRISIGAIAQLLKIPKHLIVRVECWAYGEHPKVVNRPQTRSLGLYKQSLRRQAQLSPRRRTSFL